VSSATDPRGAGARRLRAVIFDWAGTLVDHGSRAPVVALQAAFEAEGLALSEAQARGPMGLGKRDHVALLLADADVAAAWRAVHGETPSAATADRLYAGFASRLPDAVAAHTQVIPGAAEVVARLRAEGVRVGSTTGYPRSVAVVVAEAAEGQGLVVDDLAATDDVPAGRPAPWMVLRLMERLDVYPSWLVVKVGDTGVDMEEGRNAGTWCVGVTETGNELGMDASVLAMLSAAERETLAAAAGQRLLAAGAHAVLPSVADLPGVLAGLEARVTAGERP
jgi:phosphonoacetaldehyde hydrolase